MKGIQTNFENQQKSDNKNENFDGQFDEKFDEQIHIPKELLFCIKLDKKIEQSKNGKTYIKHHGTIYNNDNQSFCGGYYYFIYHILMSHNTQTQIYTFKISDSYIYCDTTNIDKYTFSLYFPIGLSEGYISMGVGDYDTHIFYIDNEYEKINTLCSYDVFKFENKYLKDEKYNDSRNNSFPEYKYQIPVIKNDYNIKLVDINDVDKVLLTINLKTGSIKSPEETNQNGGKYIDYQKKYLKYKAKYLKISKN